MNTPIYEWDWIGNKHVGISTDRVRVESRNGAIEYVPERTYEFARSYDIEGVPYGQCSNCGADFDFMAVRAFMNYCPNCGAKVVDEWQDVN